MKTTTYLRLEAFRSKVIRFLNKLLTKLFKVRLITNSEHDWDILTFKYFDDLFSAPITKAELIDYDESQIQVWIRKEHGAMPLQYFGYDPRDEEAKKYAQACAEDLVTALNEAANYTELNSTEQ